MTIERNFVYAIAGTDTLQLISSIEEQALAAKQNVEALAAARGAKIFSSAAARHDTTHDNYPFFTFKGTLPRDWSADASGTAYPQKYDEHMTIKKYIEKSQLQKQFDLHCRALCGAKNTRTTGSYGYEKLGEVTVIQCPPASNASGSYAIPADCTIISFSDYLSLLQQNIPETPPRAIIKQPPPPPASGFTAGHA
jgi:hypothetical protein